MSPRSSRPSKHLRPPRPLSSGHAGATQKADGRWLFRAITGAAATKDYRCPGCQQVISPGTPHIVAWPDQPSLSAATGVEERRHWHTACWERRR